MSSVGSSTSTPVAQITQPVSSTLSKFTTAAVLVTAVAIIAMEAIRHLNSASEIVLFANKYLPSSKTNLAISATAFAIFASRFLLSCGNKESQPKAAAQPIVAEAPTGDFIRKSGDEGKRIVVGIRASIDYLKLLPKSDEGDQAIKFLQSFLKAAVWDGRKEQFIFDRKALEVIEEMIRDFGNKESQHKAAAQPINARTPINVFIRESADANDFIEKSGDEFKRILAEVRATINYIKGHPQADEYDHSIIKYLETFLKAIVLDIRNERFILSGKALENVEEIIRVVQEQALRNSS